jgi:hypothetical protein
VDNRETTRGTRTGGWPRPDGRDELFDLVGQVGCHEAIMVAAAVFDILPNQTFTPVRLRDHIRDQVDGVDVWTPSSRVLDHYCRTGLRKAGVVEPDWMVGSRGVPVRAYRARVPPDGAAQRLRLYQALASWGLAYPYASVQQLIGPPKGGGGATPAHLRLPMYAVLLGNHPEPTSYGDLIDAVVSDDTPLHSFRQTISVLTTHQVLVRHRYPGGLLPRGAVTIAAPWVAAIRDLVDSIDQVRNPDVVRAPGQAGGWPGGHPFAVASTVADLLTKAAASSSHVVGTERGSSATARSIYDLVVDAPGPVSANHICRQLTETGRTIGRFRVLVYLKALVDAGKLTALENAGPRQGPIETPHLPTAYTAAPDPPRIDPRPRRSSTDRRAASTSNAGSHHP